MKDFKTINFNQTEKIVDGITLDDDEVMDIVVVLDRSGSMYPAQESTIKGFNAFIETEAAKGHKTFVTAVIFNTGYEVLYSRRDINEIPVLTDREYFARGGTALYDAIGKTIESIKDEIDNKVLFLIITDGMENASRSFTREQIKSYIDELDYEFIFVGADIDSYREASKIGIDQMHTANFKKSSKGVDDLFNTLNEVSDIHRARDMNLAESNWKHRLED